MKRRKYGRVRRKLVVDAYRATRSIRMAATAAGMSQSWAYQILKRGGHIKSSPPVFTVRMAKEAVALYARNLSCREVAARLAAKYKPSPSQQWVFSRVQEAGVLRSKSRAMELREMEAKRRDFDSIRHAARRLAEEKLWSVKQIARALGVTPKTVERALPKSLRCDPSLATQRRKWQAYLPDVEERRARRDRVIEMRVAGATYPQIERATGLSTSTVGLYLLRAGLTKHIARKKQPATPSPQHSAEGGF